MKGEISSEILSSMIIANTHSHISLLNLDILDQNNVTLRKINNVVQVLKN